MMTSIKTRSSLFGVALSLGLASLGVTRTAHASPTYPPALSAALEAEDPSQPHCVPLCTACHNTTVGGPGMLNVFGMTMETVGGLVRNDPPEKVAPALTKVAAAMTDSDMDGTSDIAELNAGNSPSINGPKGDGQFCSDLRYGCGARIAAAPPTTDRLGLFSAGVVVLGLALARRRRSSSRR